jgi:ADP-ribose pyrophosphatase YjhB (NUDIX family)
VSTGPGWEAAGRGPDDVARLAEGNARQARKRVSADAVLRDPAGRILLVHPVYKAGWDLPDGMAEANEEPRAALRRELREELDLAPPVGDLLCLAWAAPHGPWDDLLAFAFDAGALDAVGAAGVRTVDPELRAARFCTPDEAAALLRPHVWRRVRAAFAALADGRTRYLDDGDAGPDT